MVKELLEFVNDRVDDIPMSSSTALHVNVGLRIGSSTFVGELLKNGPRVTVAQLRASVPA